MPIVLRDDNHEVEVEHLEAQLQSLSQTAAQAIDRVAQLECELEAMHRKQNSSISSMSSHISISSDLSSCSDTDSEPPSPSDRLHTLETAIRAIHQARAELAAPHNYRYF